MKKIKNNIPYKFVNESSKDEHVMTISGAIGQGGWFYDAISAEAIDASIVDIYVQKTGLSDDEVRNMLVAETWLTAEEALAKGFATSIESVEDKQQDTTVNNIDETVINSIVERVTAQLNNQKQEPTPVEPTKPTNKRKGFLF